MNARYWIILLPYVITLLSCSREFNSAPDEHYYVEIRTHEKDAFNRELASYLATGIPQKKYTITNGSGITWPYYAAFDLDEEIPIDSLMPPHTHIHKMILGDSNALRTENDHLVRVDIGSYPDTIPNYQVQIFKMDSLGLMLTGSSGIHFIDTTEFSPRQLLYDHHLKSIIRYSFK
jgi:hypothetical protein